jgi:hypothetical protein
MDQNNEDGFEEYKEIKLQKVPLAKLVSILLNLFEYGVEYIDIIGITDDEEDHMGISFTREYMSKEARSKYDELMENTDLFSKINVNPSDDEDLNQMI